MSERQTSAYRVTLRPARREDSRSLWEWRNDPETREASFHTEMIPFETHQRWFESRLEAPNTEILIILDLQGKAIGYVRFQIAEFEAEVSVALDAQERGKGYGPAAVRQGVEILLAREDLDRVVALIKEGNTSSVRTFERAGFTRRGTKRVSGSEALEMVRSR